MRISKKRQKKRKLRNRLGMFAIALVTIVLLGVFLMQGRLLKTRIAQLEEREAALTEQIEAEAERTEEIEETKKYLQTDTYAEEIARNRLGLVKENELVFREEE